MTSSNIAAIRGEYLELSRRIFRFALFSLALIFAATILFARALSRVNDVSADIQELSGLVQISGTPTEVTYVFAAAVLPPGGRDGGGGPYTTKALEALAKQREIETKLNKLAAEWFTVHISILGFGIDLDLRSWIILLPLFIWGSNAYLILSRAKMRVLAGVAHAAVAADTDADPLDRLLFGGRRVESPYARYPGSLGTALYLVASLALLGYLVKVAAPLAGLLGARATIDWISIIALLTFYVAAYVSSRRWQIDQSGALIIGVEPRPSLTSRVIELVRRLDARIRGAVARLPRASLTAASTIVVASLIMPIATTQCEPGPRLGHEVFTNEVLIQWFANSWMQFDYVQLAPMFYRASLVIAAAALLLVPFTFARVRWPFRLLRWMRPTATLIAFFMAVELAFVHLTVTVFPVGHDLVRIVFFVVPLILWLRYARSKKPKRRERWPSIAAVLTVALAPGAACALIAIGELTIDGMWGAGLYVAAIELTYFAFAAVVAIEHSEVPTPLAAAEPA